jgi:hypothetical protein
MLPDRGVPNSCVAVSELVSSLLLELRSHRGVGIHCRIGVGRSASLAVCVLAALEVSIEDAWAMVGRSRGLAVPDTPRTASLGRGLVRRVHSRQHQGRRTRHRPRSVIVWHVPP